MPISEDEIEQRHATTTTNNNNNSTTMSKAELRRSNKPIMEKRRRARINHCLNELKTLILDAMKKDPARHSKLEKADILEMTVKHLQSIQRQQLAISVATDPSVIHKFKSGFHECAGEVSRFIGSMEGVETGVKQRLIAHLSNCINGLSQISPFTFTGMNNSNAIGSGSFHSSANTLNLSLQNNTTVPVVLPQMSLAAGDVNNNSGENSARIQMPSGIQLIPSRLPTGELALLVPNSSNMPFFPAEVANATIASQTFPATTKPIADSSTIQKKPHHASAFTTVLPGSRSPLTSPASSSTYPNDDVHSVDSFKLKTPSPPALNQPITSTPFPAQSNFKTIYLGNDPTTSQVTSTCSSPDSKSLDEPKIGYQSVPIYQPAEKSKTHRCYNEDVNESEHLASHTPVSVIISREKLKNTWHYSVEHNSIAAPSRKRSISETGSALIRSAVSEHPSKIRKCSSEIVSSSQSISGSEQRTSESSDNSSFESSTSTANTSGSSATSSTSNESMWRPW